MPMKWVQAYVASLLLSLCALPAQAAGFIIDTEFMPVEQGTRLRIGFACSVEYVSHRPRNSGKRLRIELQVSSLCSVAAPTVAGLRELHRPIGGEAVQLEEIDYDGSNDSDRSLTLTFSEPVTFDVVPAGLSSTLLIDIRVATVAAETTVATEALRPARGHGSSLIQRDEPATAYVINLSSSRRQHAASEMPDSGSFPGLRLFESEVQVGGLTWYRLRLGYFETRSTAETALAKLQTRYASAWIDRMAKPENGVVDTVQASNAPDSMALPENALAGIGLDEVDALMADARRAMVAGELSRAVQMYTKVLRLSGHDRHAEAQEYLALAREKNGQAAHARAEYQRFLEQYPDDEAAPRVRQRLAALLAVDRKAGGVQQVGTATSGVTRERSSDWRVQTFFSQYYRRDANQLNDADEIVSQSALYSDVNVDARRSGERFDFSSRLSAGYRNDFLGEDEGSGNEARISYAYADLRDSRTGLRGRLGRQSRSSGGVLGRFDGIDLGYELGDRLTLNAVAGMPVFSANNGTDSERVFYGTSINVGPLFDAVELGGFFIQQEIEGIEDRQAVGAEFRYFGESQSLWGLVDYDVSYNELSSAYLQGSMRFAKHSSVHASLDRRHSPYLSTGTAMVGQPVESFAELMTLLSEDEIRELSRDRSPISTTYTAGLSHSLTPKLQLNLDASRTLVDATPTSGGVAGMPESEYQYYSANFIASSLLREGDMSMLGLRVADSTSARILSLTLDTRVPLGRSWRINPRLRVDRREINTDGSDEWMYTPGIRIQYRRSQKLRLEFEAGRRYSQRETATMDLNRESYFVNAGYQVFF